MKRWSIIFRTLGNINRLNIIKMLSDGSKMSVSDIAENLKISFKGTSNHLIMLHKLNVLETLGAKGHVYYSINQKMPTDFRKVINLLL